MSLKEAQKWRTILSNQRLENVKKWIKELENSSDIVLLVNNEYENILRALEASLSVSTSTHLAFQLIQLLHPVVIDFADWNRWLIYLEKLDEFLPIEDKLGQAEIMIHIGDVKGRMGKLQESENEYKKGITLFKAQHEISKQAFSMGRLAIVFMQKGELTAALKLCNEAIQLADESKDLAISSRLQLNLSFIYFHARNYEQSLIAANLAYANFRQLSMQKDATKALLNIVAISNEMGNWADVEQQIQLLIDDLDNSGDITTLSQLKNVKGVASFNQNKFMEAESSWHDALILHTQMKDSSEIAGIYNNLGMVYTKLKEWSASQEMLLKAISAYGDFGDVYYKANALDNLADLYFEQNQFKDGCKVLQAAIDDLQAVNQTPHVTQLVHHIQNKLNQFQVNNSA